MAAPKPIAPRATAEAGRAAGLETSELVAARLDELERKLERLRSLYESFFAGIERRLPHVPRTELNRLMLELQQTHIRNAALRFRSQTLMQRWVLLTTYWNRTLREIENGCYRRDLERAYRRLAARGAPLTAAEAIQLGIPAGRAESFVARQNRGRPGAGAQEAAPPPVVSEAPPGPAGAAPVAQPAAPGAPVPPVPLPEDQGDDLDFPALYAAYVRAHAEAGRAGPPPTAERLRARISAELEHLRAAGATTPLELAIVARGGKVVMEARARRRR
jgi:hypothetical protein